MRKLLQIGEVAQLLGITPKAIRHYQKIGLLQEPERSHTGYRLYSAHDLLRLHQIKRLQSLGLSLKHIKAVLGDPTQQRTLREVLQALDAELYAQVQVLEERRAKINILLNESPLDTVEHLPIVSPTFEQVTKQLGDLLSHISPQLWEQEAKMDALLDAFQWPNGFQEMIMRFYQSIAACPEQYQRLLMWGEQFAALAHLPEDTPEVSLLIDEWRHDEILLVFQQDMQALSAQALHMEAPFAQAMSDVLSTALSPAQKRLVKEMSSRSTT